MIRYRTESFSGLGYRDAVSVMYFETFELMNTDILLTLKEKKLIKGALLSEAERYIYCLQNSTSEVFNEEEGKRFFEEVLRQIFEITGKDIRYVLWLADKETVFDFYGKDMVSESDFEQYETDGAIVLSELGYDGTLYGYEKEPCPVL